MKARVKDTGVELEVHLVDKQTRYKGNDGILYWEEDLDFGIEDKNNPDYWTRLEHQYAGMAMQTMLATLYNPKYHKELMACYTEVDAEEVARLSKYCAHALVEKMKENEKAMH